METIAVKIGGSVLTDKKSISMELRRDVLRGIASDVKYLLDKGYRVILTHGVGTVGHVIVGKHELHKGVDTPEKLLALTEAQNRVNELVRVPLLRIFEEAGVPVVMFYPSSIVYQENGRLTELYDAAMRRFFETGFVPVMSGDMAADKNDQLRMTVCSADQLTLELAERFNASKAVFLVDVDGVYRGAHSNEIISKLTLKDLEEALSMVGGSAPIDVSGGMKGKLAEVLRHRSFLEKGGEVYIINGLTPHSLVNLLEGRLSVYTRITG